jgi:hypothetical protein
VVVAVAGALVVSALALRAPVIRGHGIPEAMEAVLVRQSRIAPRAALAKPLSAAVSIGTGVRADEAMADHGGRSLPRLPMASQSRGKSGPLRSAIPSTS